MYNTADQVALRYAQPVEIKELIGAAIKGLYAECGLAVPDRVAQAVSDARARSTSSIR